MVEPWQPAVIGNRMGANRQRGMPVNFGSRTRHREPQTFTRAMCAGIMALQLSGVVSAQSKATLAEENAQLQAAFDLMLQKLSTRDAEIRELKQRIAELEGKTGSDVTPTLGCAVDDARQLIVAESFLYDREKVLLGWLADNVSGCKLNDLRKLDALAKRSSLSQSRGVIRDELQRRGESLEGDVPLVIPLPKTWDDSALIQ